MHVDPVWYTLGTLAPAALLQWWATRAIHRKRVAAVQAKHLKSQQAADKMLQQSRRQNAQLAQELAAARLSMKRPQRVESVPSTRADARDALMKILDEAPPSRRILPVDGFAETMPSLQFRPSGMSPLQ